MNGGQASALVESTIAYICNTAGDGHGSQFSATLECIPTDSGHTVGNGYRGYTTTPIESPIAYRSYARFNYDRLNP